MGVFLFCFSCQHLDDVSASLSQGILDRYPELISISPNGRFRLLKRRGLDSFTLYLEDSEYAFRKILDRRDWSQLSIKWNPNGDKIIFQAYDPHMGRYLLFLVDVVTGTKEEIPGAVSASAVPPVVWSPNGQQVAFLAISSKSSFQIISTESNSISKYDPNGLNAASHYQWESDTTMIYNVPQHGELFRLHLITRSEEVIMSRPELEIKQFALSQLGQKVALIARNVEDEFFAAYMLNVTSNSFTEIYKPDAQVEKIAWLNASTLVIQADDQGRQKVFRYSEAALQHYGPMSVSLDLQLNQEIFWARVHRADAYPSLALLTLDSIIEYPAQPGPEKAYDLKPVVIAPDSIPALLYAPFNASSSPKVVIHLHGGPYLQSRPYWHFDRHYLAALGHYFLTVNYRGSSGYSRSFAEAGSLPNQVADLRSAINYAVDTLTIDEKDIFIYTESYAAQIAHQYLTVQNSAEVGGFFMLYPTLDARQLVQLSKQKQINAYLFYGAEDPYLRVDLDQLSLLADETKHLKVFVLTNEGHYFHRSGSWVEVMTQMTQALK